MSVVRSKKPEYKLRGKLFPLLLSFHIFGYIARDSLAGVMKVIGRSRRENTMLYIHDILDQMEKVIKILETGLEDVVDKSAIGE